MKTKMKTKTKKEKKIEKKNKMMKMKRFEYLCVCVRSVFLCMLKMNSKTLVACPKLALDARGFEPTIDAKVCCFGRCLGRSLQSADGLAATAAAAHLCTRQEDCRLVQLIPVNSPARSEPLEACERPAEGLAIGEQHW